MRKDRNIPRKTVEETSELLDSIIYRIDRWDELLKLTVTACKNNRNAYTASAHKNVLKFCFAKN